MRGWCPSLHAPMESGDGWLVRVKPRLATLSSVDAAYLAHAAAMFGSGVIELTSRANLQFRGFTATRAAQFARVVVEQHLGSAEAEVERRRNVIVSPLVGVDPSVAPGTAEIALAMEAMLVDDPDLAGLPGKFGVVVDGGGLLAVADAPGDICVQLRGHVARISLDGSAMAAVVPEAEAVGAVRRIIGVFLEHRAARRMRELVPEAVFAGAGLRPEVLRLSGSARARAGHIGFGADGVGAFGFGLAFGQMTATALLALADLARDHGDGSLRISPWRVVQLPGLPPASAVLPAGIGLIADPGDPALGIEACAGMPACGHATVATRADAAVIAASGVLRGRALHVSGCAKGCAHPRACGLTLVGEAGRYNLVRHGRADAMPVATGLRLEEAVALLDDGDFE